MYRHAHYYYLLVLAATVAGFWPSFFSRMGAFQAGPLLHGLTATLWLVLLVVQSWLITHGRPVWHRRVARLSFVLAPSLVLSALPMVQAMLGATRGFPPDLRLMLAFIDLVSLALFSVLFALALATVRRVADHARYISATSLVGLPPALTRLFYNLGGGDLGFHQALFASFVVVEVALLVLLWFDWRKGLVRPAYPVTLGTYLFMHALYPVVASFSFWQDFCRWFAQIGR